MNKQKIEIWFINILAPQSLALMIDLFCGDIPHKYNLFRKASFMPQYIYLTIFSTIFYIMIGISYYYIYLKKESTNIDEATTNYCYFILSNFLANIILYNVFSFIANMAINIIIIIYGIKCIKSFKNIDKRASIIFSISFLWNIYYIILQIFLYKLN